MRKAFTLVELLIVIVILSVLVAVLLPALNRSRSAALQRKLQVGSNLAWGDGQQMAASNLKQIGNGVPPAPPPLARVKSFTADIALTPRLSVGTSEPESIYEAKFTAKIAALAPRQDGEYEVHLPLPPQIISLSDLSVTANGEPSEMVALRDNKLVWRGTLHQEPTMMEFTYTAVGKGLYALEIPPGGILDSFKIALSANGSDVRMLELSLQPTSVIRSSDATQYTWDYKRLMFGQPIRLDVLGIAPIDRLGELSWLGPISVVLFGILLGLVANSFRIQRFDRWMLLLILGTFTGSYPLMYFAQEFVSLRAAIFASSAICLLIIGIRSLTIMGLPLALGGVVLPAAGVLAITLIAAVRPEYQGILLTVETIAFFVSAMLLLPKIAPRERETRSPKPESPELDPKPE